MLEAMLRLTKYLQVNKAVTERPNFGFVFKQIAYSVNFKSINIRN
jgi:hypothetical protein